MNDFRRAVEGFRPNVDEELGAVMQRAERRRRNRQLLSVVVAFTVFVAGAAGAWVAFARTPGPKTPVGPAPQPTARTTAPVGPVFVPAECPGVWSTCAQARWTRRVAEAAGYRVVGGTWSALEVTGDGLEFYLWAIEPPAGGEGQSLQEEIRRGVFRLIYRVDATKVYTDGTRAVWTAHGLDVYWEGYKLDGRFEQHIRPPETVIDRLVRASRQVAYPLAEDLCPYPPVRATYLPWLAPGEVVPEPDMSRVSAGVDGGDSASLEWINPKWGRSIPPYYVMITRQSDAVSGSGQHVDIAVGEADYGELYSGGEGRGGSAGVVWNLPNMTRCATVWLALEAPDMTEAEARAEILRIAESLELAEWPE